MKTLIVAILGILLSAPLGIAHPRTIEHPLRVVSVTQVSTMTHKKCPLTYKWMCKLAV
jgi:hypothetical protein